MRAAISNSFFPATSRTGFDWNENLMTNAHEDIEMLLPWYVSGTLNSDEVAQVDAHLAKCSACLGLLAEEHLLKSAVAVIPLRTPQFSVPPLPVADRPSIARRGWQAAKRTVSRWTASPMRVATFAAAQAAMLIIVFQLAQPSVQPNAQYRTLSATASVSANAVVMFKPETTEAEFRKLLAEAGANIVGGPTETNAYLLKLPAMQRDVALERLRKQPKIMLAQPLDGQ
jgi:hypothetical protein